MESGANWVANYGALSTVKQVLYHGRDCSARPTGQVGDLVAYTTNGRLRLPAILQNPVNKAQRQVIAHNNQQKEKAAARREARAADPITDGTRGKRYTRRKDNGALRAITART